MKFRTTCPQCASMFRLDSSQLDAAQGWVQCGVCGSAFDARLELLQEDGSPLPPPAPAVEPELAPPVAAEPLASAEPEATSPPAEDTAPPTPAPEPAAPPVGISQRETALDLPSIILIDPDQAPAEEPGPLPEIPPPPGLPPVYPPPQMPEPAALPAAPLARTEPAAPTTRVEYARPQPAAPQPDVWAPPRRRIGPAAWAVASVLLGLLLLVQSAYFLRDTLASQIPPSRPVLERACELLGCTLSLPKNLAQLQIVGSDLQTEAGGNLRLTLTLGNRAGHAQAWPMLVLTLTDQRNRPLARRSFAPSEYLDDARRIAAGVPPRSEQPLTLPLAVHDLAPMGFDLKLSY